MSVMNGLQNDLREKILTNTPHLLIQKYNSEPIDDYAALTRTLRATPGVVGAVHSYIPKGSSVMVAAERGP